ncbi:MAG: TonB-dependent receptor [Deltaproteobacteria bacterium]|nr:TonB-dependent receptor [Deltaproteobacteria bacterium]
MKDKLCFFAAYGNKIDSYSQAAMPPEFPRFHQYKTYFGKLNWQINPKHKMQFSFNLDDFVTERNAAPNKAPTTNKMFWGKTPAPSLSYTGLLTESTMLEVRYGGYYGNLHSSPKNVERRDGPSYWNYVSGGDCSLGPCLVTGGANYWYDLEEVSTNATVSLSHYADDFLGGSHDFKFGVQYKRAGRQNALMGYTDYFYLFEDDNGDEYVYGIDYSPFGYGGIANNIAVFVDDTFRVNDRLTLKLGARYDMDRASVPEMSAVDPVSLAATGEPFPEVSSLYDFNSFSPRLGFTYKLTEDGKTLLRGHWGRYHRGINTMDFGGGVGNIGTTDMATFVGYYDVEGWYAMTLEGDGRGIDVGGAPTVAMDPNVKSGHTDQAVLGFERELGANFGLSLTYSHKRASDFPAWRDSTGQYDTVEVVEPITGIPLTLSRLISDPEERFYLLGTPENLYSRIHAGILVLNKRMSDGWQLRSSLQLLRGTGAMGSQYTENGGSGRMRGGIPWGSFGKKPNNFVNLGGRLIGDLPVTFKTQLMAELPAGFLLGANYTYQSGGNWSRTARISGTNVGRDTVLLEERDGSQRVDSRSMMDLRVQWSAKLVEEASLSVFLDVFNVFNSSAGQSIRSTRVGSPELGLPGYLVLPRRLQVGAKLQF